MNRRSLLLATVLLAVAAATWLWSRADTTRPAEAPAEVAAPALPPPSRPLPTIALPVVPPPPAIPTRETAGAPRHAVAAFYKSNRMLDRLDALRDLADAGEPRAACRIARLLLACGPIRNHVASLRPPGAVGETRGVSTAATELRGLAIECSMFASDAPTLLSHYLRQAALAGDPESMLRYADGQHWPEDFAHVFADPVFDAWRAEALPMLERARAAGIVEAVELLEAAYAHDATPLAGLVENDAETAMSYALLRARFGGPTPEQLADAAAQQRAATRAEAMYRRDFAGGGTHVDAQSPVPGALDPDKESEACGGFQ
ncbi:hypothetical protein [Arenimonas composti]|uniref:Uncharacterized protein n=1 Tax=Arenimonas composti TR7-09 = DSM 18010 TaxID=1121013 RepID=A0A091BGB6_9GAMM|nr:hypothetical protein [Arenimonas composti]KFN50791.1 hypothetical protein P873_05040 [Arenimonas composti TR7-09 = DSM 18010]